MSSSYRSLMSCSSLTSSMTLSSSLMSCDSSTTSSSCVMTGSPRDGKALKGQQTWAQPLGCVTCHACHGCVTDFRPILGNPVEVTHVTSPGHVYIFPH